MIGHRNQLSADFTPCIGHGMDVEIMKSGEKIGRLGLGIGDAAEDDTALGRVGRWQVKADEVNEDGGVRPRASRAMYVHGRSGSCQIRETSRRTVTDCQ